MRSVVTWKDGNGIWSEVKRVQVLVKELVISSKRSKTKKQAIDTNSFGLENCTDHMRLYSCIYTCRYVEYRYLYVHEYNLHFIMVIAVFRIVDAYYY